MDWRVLGSIPEIDWFLGISSTANQEQLISEFGKKRAATVKMIMRMMISGKYWN